jgi:hypothetical protein
MNTRELIAGLDANLRRAEALVAGMSREQFNWHPGPGRWSVAQCLTHLNVVNGQDLVTIGEAIASARERGLLGAPPFRYGWLSRKFVASMEPPVRSRMKAPKGYTPPPEAEPHPTLAEYTRIAAELRRLILSAEGVDLARAKTTLPALPRLLRSILRMPLGARFELILAHDRRHLWQGEQVRNQAATQSAPSN